MFISIKKAGLKLRNEAGFSIALASEEVKKLKKVVDGKREKVRSADVNRIISDAMRPTPAPDAAFKIRPFQKRVIDQIRASSVGNR